MKGNSSALRKGRYSEAGRIYLVTFVTHLRKSLFNDTRTGCSIGVPPKRRFNQEEDRKTAIVIINHISGFAEKKTQNSIISAPPAVAAFSRSDSESG
jgi:putative transposase